MKKRKLKKQVYYIIIAILTLIIFYLMELFNYIIIANKTSFFITYDLLKFIIIYLLIELFKKCYKKI